MWRAILPLRKQLLLQLRRGKVATGDRSLGPCSSLDRRLSEQSSDRAEVTVQGLTVNTNMMACNENFA